jgi:hypothetical protein
VKFWDASAIVHLLVNQPATQRVQALAAKDPAMLVWWGTEVECASAVSRLEREGDINPPAVSLAFTRLTEFKRVWTEVDPSESVREAAVRFLRVHPLCAGDALQLAAAYLGAERRPASLELVSLDDRLAAAARKEGFAVTDLTAAD